MPPNFAFGSRAACQESVNIHLDFAASFHVWVTSSTLCTQNGLRVTRLVWLSWSWAELYWRWLRSLKMLYRKKVGARGGGDTHASLF